MAKTFAINDNNDIYIKPDGRLAIAVDLEAVMQACQTAAQAQRGEMVLAVDAGIPNFQTVWNGVPNIPQWEAALQVTLLDVENVQQILKLTTNVENNTLFYSVTILTDFGVGTING